MLLSGWADCFNVILVEGGDRAELLPFSEMRGAPSSSVQVVFNVILVVHLKARLSYNCVVHVRSVCEGLRTSYVSVNVLSMLQCVPVLATVVPSDTLHSSTLSLLELGCGIHRYDLFS